MIDAAGSCPPEDIGGLSGYSAFLEAIADPDHEEHEERLTWVGGNFDPEVVEVEAHARTVTALTNR